MLNHIKTMSTTSSRIPRPEPSETRVFCCAEEASRAPDTLRRVVEDGFFARTQKITVYKETAGLQPPRRRSPTGNATATPRNPSRPGLGVREPGNDTVVDPCMAAASWSTRQIPTVAV